MDKQIEQSVVNNNDIVLETINLTKKYGNFIANNNISIKIKRGDIYGLVGENGSGKTTLMRIITGLQSPTSGTYKLFGAEYTNSNILVYRNKMRGIIEAPSFFPNFKAVQNLKYQGLLVNKKIDDNYCNELLRLVGLDPATILNKKVKQFSLGMRQRLSIAMSLIGDPEFLILDEPINGLDPQGVAEIRNLIVKLSQEKKITIIISSHILSELSKVATKYGFIHKGRLIQELTAEQLEAISKKQTIVTISDAASAMKFVDAKNMRATKLSDNEIALDSAYTLKQVMEIFAGSNIEIENIKVVEQDLEGYYIDLVTNAMKGEK